MSREKILKVLALARRGIDGEKRNAEKMLAKMLKKEGLTLEDLLSESEEKEYVKFSFRTSMEKKLLLQLAWKLGIESYALMDMSGLARVFYEMGEADRARDLSAKVMKRLEKHKTVEDIRRAYYNHFVCMKEGTKEERESANKALMKAKALVEDRLAGMVDAEMKEDFINNVPLVRDILEEALLP